MSNIGSQIVFHITGLTKSKRVSKPHFSLKLSQFTEDGWLDVTKAVRSYVKHTKHWRGTDQGKTQLYLATIEPHKPVATCSVARWLKLMIGAAGIDTEIYKAHSTRSASTSKANTQGLLVDQIVGQANWSRAQTFHKFYNKKVTSHKFQEAVLSSIT